jgi:hypothetical protein
VDVNWELWGRWVSELWELWELTCGYCWELWGLWGLRIVAGVETVVAVLRGGLCLGLCDLLESHYMCVSDATRWKQAQRLAQTQGS